MTSGDESGSKRDLVSRLKRKRIDDDDDSEYLFESKKRRFH